MNVTYYDDHRYWWSKWGVPNKWVHSPLCTKCMDNKDLSWSVEKKEWVSVVKSPEDQIAELKSSIAEAEKVIKDLQKKVRFGIEPSGGSIIKFEKQYGGKASQKYTYAALRYGNDWFLSGTGAAAARSYSWEDLKKFIGDGKSWIMTVKEQVPDGRVVQSW